ncbi:carbohydrate sulfotransferase 8-like isoform X1 [Lethenteron reissneri]|uniref:carbohydrate sulfotransferase 8-like isoform X1 n=1 Tax=Lethenteron reissneri TaxID=7753 RepID=UPI002AB79DCF|nr:carbohydrate sulfotransferase 8-like isoform X1 [Lethenteron reissneri]XP_061433292.1 carbohydrate sulfotransferase 8-like isoform X1 [Lethenteron reissneri]
MMRALDFYQWLLAVGAGILIYSFLLSIQVLPNSPLTPSHLKSVDSQSSEKAGTALPATNSSAQLQGQTSGDCSRGGTGCPSPRTGQDADRHSKVASSPSPDSWGNLLMGKLLEENQEERLSTLTTECKQLRERGILPQSPSPRVQEWLASRIYVADRYAFMYCEVPKTGCTNWKRTFLALMGNIKSSKVMTQNQVHNFNYTKLSSFDTSGQRSRLDNYTMVMFVREPMERLVSAYRDKFLHSKHYKKVYGRAIISHYRKNPSRMSLTGGHDVTFPEMVRFILDPERPLGQDVHWLPAHHLCQPCLLRYDYLGKVETLGRDAAELLARVRAPESVFYSSPKDKRSSASLTGYYLAQLSSKVRQQLYTFYYGDYKLFGYPLPSDMNI